MKKYHVIKAILFLAVLFSVSCFTACGGKTLTREQKITDDFNTIEIDTDVSDVTILPSEDGECRIVCSEHEKITHVGAVDGSTLNIEVLDKRNVFEKIFTPKMKLTVYLPRSEYGALTAETDTGSVTVDGDLTFDSVCIDTDTGDVELENVKAGEIAVGTDTGEIDCESVRCTIFAAKTETGDISLGDVIADGKFDIVSETGDVEFEDCDAASVFVTTDTGDVKGSFLTDKVIFADTDTGKVEIPKLTSGGKCEITTSTGDIKITIG